MSELRDYTVREAAEVLGVSRGAIYKAIHDGRLSTDNSQYYHRIDGADLFRWNGRRELARRARAKQK